MTSKVFIPTYLYIKQHSVTGKLYFGKTIQNPEMYLGTGLHWKNHLRVHGNKVITLWYCLFYDKEELTKFALSCSKQWNIVESEDWLNLKDENGLDGGGDSLKNNTYTKGHKWYNDGETSKRFIPDKQPAGWILGRLNQRPPMFTAKDKL